MKKLNFIGLIVLMLLVCYAGRVHILKSSKLTLENRTDKYVSEISVNVIGDSCFRQVLKSDVLFSCRLYPKESGSYSVQWTDVNGKKHTADFGYNAPNNNFGDLAAFTNSSEVVHLNEHYFWPYIHNK